MSFGNAAMTNIAKPIEPIQTGLLKTMRYMKRSYNNPLEHGQDLRREYGNVVMQKAGKMRIVHLFGANAHKLCLLNPNQTFSNKKAWDMIIGRIFPNGLMLRDGDDHRYHRRLMQAGFKSKAMQGYLGQMIPQVKAAVAGWSSQGDKLVYPTFKQMTLDLAASIFLGMNLGDDADKINTAFETAVAASMPRIPFAFPGTLLWRGIKARETMCDFFLPMIPTRRDGDGQDLFSLLCKAKDEEGAGYTDQEIVDHMIFLMMAAHDTTTSTLTSTVYSLAKNPQWQDRLVAEMNSLDLENLTTETLSSTTEIDWVIKEALRMYPPLSTLPKMSNTAFEYEGHLIPAGALVITYPIHTHYMSEYWDNPETFDPTRFSPAKAEHKRHDYSWVPFSGGAHMCIGLHFANMQIKLVLFEMLKTYTWQVAEGYEMPVQQSPISKPKDDLPVTFVTK
ncbi:MAG TPA: cytochrome P450 [Gammaproteobacteria bacterium]|nr:cytochrome P450 [Gammaproteobacteria bacterium]